MDNELTPQLKNLRRCQNARIVGIVGPYGSGKSEVALALAEERIASMKTASPDGFAVALADLDVLKPFFRSREARASLAACGVRLVAPEEGLSMSDLPVLPQEIRSLLVDRSLCVILDIGGDAVGARALGSISDVVAAQDHELLLVLNRHRPFMQDAGQVAEQIRAIQTATQLKITGIISNTHMMGETTMDDIRWGLALAEEVAVQFKVGVCRTGVPDLLVVEARAAKVPEVLPIRRRMLPGFLGGVVLAQGATRQQGRVLQ